MSTKIKIPNQFKRKKLKKAKMTPQASQVENLMNIRYIPMESQLTQLNLLPRALLISPELKQEGRSEH